MTTMEQIAAAAAGELDAWWIVGGNFLETVGGEERSRRALAKPGLRIHQDIMLSSAMLVEPSDTVLILPATTRYEIAGGVTETTTERRIVYSPEIAGPRVAGARDEWRVLCEVAQRGRPERAAAMSFADTGEIRAEIARAIPLYAGIEKLSQKGDQLQWGGATLFADGRFATADGKAHFAPVEPPPRELPADHFRVSTRRGKQFNSMVQAEIDPLNGAARDDVLISELDARRLGLRPGDAVELRSAAGSWRGRARPAAIKPGTLEVHWPEGMALLAAEGLDPASGEPDYNAIVTVEKLTGAGAPEPPAPWV